MQIEVNPPLQDGERRAVLVALEHARLERAGDPYRATWRVAALREAVDEDAETGYAFSPRSTRGATRA